MRRRSDLLPALNGSLGRFTGALAPPSAAPRAGVMELPGPAPRVTRPHKGPNYTNVCFLNFTHPRPKGRGFRLFVRRWLGKALGLEPKAPGEALRGRVEIKGRKLNRLLDLVHALKKAGATLVVVDEFEKAVQTPEYYGFKDLGDLLINFFEMVDRWPRPGAGYTIPSTLWAFLDLQTGRRVAPVYHLSIQITTDDMKKFLERKLGAVPEELKEVNFRNPAVVAEIVAEVKSRGVQTVIRDRFSWLGKIAYCYPKASEKTRRALHAAYISTWYMQNIYAEIPPSLLHKAADIAQSEDPATVLSKRRRKLLAKTPSGYMLTYPAISHIREALTTPQRQQVLGLTYVADRLRLELEIP